MSPTEKELEDAVNHAIEDTQIKTELSSIRKDIKQIHTNQTRLEEQLVATKIQIAKYGGMAVAALYAFEKVIA